MVGAGVLVGAFVLVGVGVIVAVAVPVLVAKSAEKRWLLVFRWLGSLCENPA